MISGVVVASARGDIVFSRYFRNDVPESVSELFRIAVLLPNKDEYDIKPVTSLHKVSFMHIKVSDVYLAAVTNQNANTFVVFEFLYKVVALLTAYFGGKFNIKKIKSNFLLIHELLEEIMDYGYPQITDEETLKLYITQGKINPAKLSEEKVKKITETATGATPWRPPNISYKKNELWIDVLEKINLLVSHQGTILKSDVEGEIHLKCNLSGMPECEFGINDSLLIEKEKERGKKVSTESIALDDLTFHQCVRLQKFEEERAVSFVPPDGDFVLMKYRSTERITLPFRILSHVKQISQTRMDYEVTVIAEFSVKLNGAKVRILVPTPDNTAVVKTSVKGGKAKYEPNKGGIEWKVSRFPGQSEIILRASVELIGTASKIWDRPPITMDFTVPMFAASGLKIRYLRVTDKSGYAPQKWVRYMTKAGSYQRRL